MQTLEVKKENSKDKAKDHGNFPDRQPYWKYFFQKKWIRFSVIPAVPSCRSTMRCMITSKK